MDSMDNFRQRFEALERQTAQLKHQTRMVERRLRWWRSPWHVAVVIALGLALALPHTIQAKTFQCGAGDVQCLIDAINDANANGEKNTIRLEAGTYTLTAVDNGTQFDTNGLPVITGPLTITGAGAEATSIERDASASRFRILAITAPGNLILKRLTLRGGGFGLGLGATSGGGISNGGTLTLSNCILSGNTASRGGGISNSGTLTLSNCILSGNGTLVGGGGIANDPEGQVTITKTTFVHNGAGPLGDGGGGLLNFGTVTIAESTFVGNGGDDGGGFQNEKGGTVIVINTTIAQNSVLELGGGIGNSGVVLLQNTTVAENQASGARGGITNGGIVLLQNTILARNVAGFFGGGIPSDCGGTVTSLGTNLIGDPTGCTIILQPSDLTGDPGLDAFTDNGRPGNGHFPLLPTSQAIDAGNDAVCPRRDQIGQRRIGPCDIGAIRFLDQDDRQRDEEDDRQHEEDPAAAAQATQ